MKQRLNKKGQTTPRRSRRWAPALRDPATLQAQAQMVLVGTSPHETVEVLAAVRRMEAAAAGPALERAQAALEQLLAQCLERQERGQQGPVLPPARRATPPQAEEQDELIDRLQVEKEAYEQRWAEAGEKARVAFEQRWAEARKQEWAEAIWERWVAVVAQERRTFKQRWAEALAQERAAFEQRDRLAFERRWAELEPLHAELERLRRKR